MLESPSVCPSVRPPINISLMHHVMITTWHGNTFWITDPLWGESTSGFPSQRASNAELWYFLCCYPESVEQIVELPVIWNTMMHIWHHLCCSITDMRQPAYLNMAVADALAPNNHHAHGTIAIVLHGLYIFMKLLVSSKFWISSIFTCALSSF